MNMEEERQFLLTPSTMWGAVYKARGANRLRVLSKQQLTQKFGYPYLDHSHPERSQTGRKEWEELIERGVPKT